MKYPIGIQDFESLRNDGYTYIDKTAQIYELAQEGKYYFLSRPRRFGKSLLLSTMEAYFRGKKELFHGLEMEKLEKDWTVYPILHLDLNPQIYDSISDLEQVLDYNLRQWERIYGEEDSTTSLSLRFMSVIKNAYEKTGQRVVILVDEYDKPLIQNFDNDELQDKLRSTLKVFYSVLKTQDKYIRFGFFTGVTKFGKISIFSDLNYLTDLSLDWRYATICGITEKEMLGNFQEGIQAIADRYHISYDDACARLKKRYDGYHFVENSEGVYNPFSLLSTLSKKQFGSYWFETGTPTFLVKLLKRDNFYLPDLTTQEVPRDFLNSVDSVEKTPVSIIYQSGYLTIKDYDEEFDTYTLGFPNDEVEEGFTYYLLPYYTHVEGKSGPMFIGNFVQDLRKGKPDDFMQRMASLFAGMDYRVIGDAEKYFQNAFYLVTILLGFYVDVERTLSDGRIDMVCKTKDYIYIFEFKYDQSADAALRQIDDKGYAAPFASDRRKLYKIGVNFSREKRCIDDWKIV